MIEEYENQAPGELPYFKGEKASIIEKIDPEEIVELLRNRLMGMIFDRNKGEWKTNVFLKDNAISEIGAWDISNLILSISNQNTSLSKLDDKTIRKRAYSLTETAVHMLICNWKEYKITNTSQIRFIADIIYSLTLITLKMADAEGIRKMIMGMYSESKNINEMSNLKSKSFFRNERRLL